MSDQSNSPASSLDQALEKVKPLAQKAWVSSRPTLVTLLKGTIGTLQTAVTHLETQIQQDGSTIPSLDFTPIQKVANTFWEKTQPLWAKIIAFLRTKLPQDINTKLSDRSLSGILAGLLLLFFWITSSIGGSAPVTRQPIAARPVPPVRPANPAPTAPNITQQFPIDVNQANQQPFPSDLSQPGTATRAVAPTPVTPPSAPPTVTTQPVTTQPVTTQPRAAQPRAAQPTPSIVPVQPPKPAPILTPEQKLLAKLQEKLPSDGNNLTQAVQPNPAIAQLKVTLANDWYQLSTDQQDQLAAALLNQAQTLKFKSLELLDSKNNLLARSPIVGDEMVILLRHLS